MQSMAAVGWWFQQRAMERREPDERQNRFKTQSANPMHFLRRLFNIDNYPNLPNIVIFMSQVEQNEYV
jgi:hypothetical protein